MAAGGSSPSVSLDQLGIPKLYGFRVKACLAKPPHLHHLEWQNSVPDTLSRLLCTYLLETIALTFS
jgi:hypothetical protein